MAFEERFMPNAPVMNVRLQVARACRRLFVQTLLDSLARCWAAALLLCTLWFLIQPWLLGPMEGWVRWAVAGGVFALCTIAGVWLAWRRAPSAVEAALEIDLRFKLKERATTSLTLAPELARSSAGQALLLDADAHAAKLDVRAGFPVRLSRTAALVPVCAAALAVVALFYSPVFRSSEADAAKDAQKVANAADIAEKFNNLKKQAALTLPNDQLDDKMAEIEKLREKLLRQPFDPSDKDKLRERLQEMVPLEDMIKSRLDDLKSQQARNKSLQEKLKEMGKDKESRLAKDGPAKELEDALNRGDLDKAQKEIMALAEKLKSDKLSDEERQQLQKQLEDIEQKLNNLADLGDLKEQLRKDFAEGRLTQEEFDKLMARASADAEDFEELHRIGKLLGEFNGSLADGELDDAADRLIAIAKYIRDFDPNGEEYQRCLSDQQVLAECLGAIRQSLGNGPYPGGQRRASDDANTTGKAERQRAELSGKTQFTVTGVQKGGSFSKVPANQVGGVFRQAQQDAPDAIERQQVPPDAAEILRGYYENLGGGQKK
jgi:uncharacterized coiled-coil DUF342 family protein